jgi:hypothetical protein
MGSASSVLLGGAKLVVGDEMTSFVWPPTLIVQYTLEPVAGTVVHWIAVLGVTKKQFFAVYSTPVRP